MEAGELLLTIAVVVAVTLALTLYARRQTKRSWRGQVDSVRDVSRSHQSDQDDPGTTEHFVVVSVRTDEGRRVKVDLPRQAFEQLFPNGLEPGDRLVKESGAAHPVPEG